jgi:TonB family protein
MELIMRNHVGETLKAPKKFLLAAAGLATLVVPLAIGVMTAPRLWAQSSAAMDRAAFNDGLTGGSEFLDQTTAGSRRQVYSAGKDGVGYPTCAYCPNPKYSDQALKAKFEGSVRLDAVITPEGRATKIKVVKEPGLGLGEKAIEAVKEWKFKPAAGPDGTPVAVDVPIEVSFRLTMNKP